VKKLGRLFCDEAAMLFSKKSTAEVLPYRNSRRSRSQVLGLRYQASDAGTFIDT